MVVDNSLLQNAETYRITKSILKSKHEFKEFIACECLMDGLRRDACFLGLLAHRSPLLAYGMYPCKSHHMHM